VATVRAAAALDGAATLRLRPHLLARLEGERLRSRAGEMTLEAVDRPLVDALLTTRSATAAGLGLDLARRLLLAGVVVMDEAVSPDVAVTDELSHP
jgi:hypothetical protein